MLKDRAKLYQAYHAVLSMALTWAMILVINQYFNLQVLLAVSAIYAFIPTIIIYLFDINKRNTISYFLLGGIIPVLALIFWITRTNPVKWLFRITDWCYRYDGSEELYHAGHANIIVFAAACAGAILFYLLTIKQTTKILLAALLLAAMIILCIRKIDCSKAVACICIFYILTVIVELYGIVKSHKEGKKEKREGILYLAPVCLLLAVLSIALPSKPEPIQWTMIKNLYHNVVEQIEVWKTDLNYYFGKDKGEFFIGMTGYSEDSGELESDRKLVKSSKVALKISGPEKNKPVYLIGSVSDVYTGRRWERSNTDYRYEKGDYFLDNLEMFYALSRQDLEILQNNRFLNRKTIRITFQNIKTKTFFYPDKMSSFDILTKNNKLSLEIPQIRFTKARGKGTSYQTVYYEMNLQGDAFARMLMDADTFSYQESMSVDAETALYVQEKILTDEGMAESIQDMEYYEILRERAERIKKEYTVLPDQLPSRVYDLADNITAPYQTKYEKLKAIESYLIQNYTYSLDPQKLPKGADFVDYFLFESKEGYCTSFASAMAILSRCIGIPTRYVEGYAFKCKEPDRDGKYPVKNSYAHAWAEAYIEGIGWIPFEATAPYYESRYTVWKEYNRTDNTGIYQFDPSAYYNKETQPGQTEAVTEEAKEREDKADQIYAGILIFLIIILVIIMILMIYYIVLRYRYRKEYERADNGRRMYMLFLRILRLLKREGFELGQQETILMLSDKVKDSFIYDQVTFPEVADIFMRYRYGQEEITKAALDKVAAYHRGLAAREKEEKSRFRVWLNELIFLMRGGY